MPFFGAPSGGGTVEEDEKALSDSNYNCDVAENRPDMFRAGHNRDMVDNQLLQIFSSDCVDRHLMFFHLCHQICHPENVALSMIRYLLSVVAAETGVQ